MGGWLISHVKTVASNVKKRTSWKTSCTMFFRQLWLIFGVKLMEINSNLLSRHHFFVCYTFASPYSATSGFIGFQALQEFTNQLFPKTHGSVENGSLER